MGMPNSNAIRNLEKSKPILKCIPRAKINSLRTRRKFRAKFQSYRIDRIADVYAAGNKGKRKSAKDTTSAQG